MLLSLTSLQELMTASDERKIQFEEELDAVLDSKEGMDMIMESRLDHLYAKQVGPSARPQKLFL